MLYSIKPAGQPVSRSVQTGHADKRCGKRCGQALCHADADAQAGKRARPLGINDGAQIGRTDARFGEKFAGLRQNQFGLPVADFIVADKRPAVGAQGERQE